MRRAGALMALALAFAAAEPARAGILTREDATEAAQSLADAQAEQGVCYGWTITNDFDGLPDVGSSMGGPGQAPDFSQCRQYVHLTGNIHYACESCEDEDSAEVAIDSNLSPPPSESDFDALGLEAGALTGDEDDVTLVNMIQALPLLATGRGGGVAPVPAETPQSVPATDTPTGAPGSDFVREAWLKLVFFIFLIGAGAAFWWHRRDEERKEIKRQRRKQKRLEQRRRTQEPKEI